VVLDIGLPKMDGISVLEAWRRNGRVMPVLDPYSARPAGATRCRVSMPGADDYVAKPFHLEGNLARIRALLRRSPPVHAQSELICRSVSLDYPHPTTGQRVGQSIKMTSHEYRLWPISCTTPDAWCRAPN